MSFGMIMWWNQNKKKKQNYYIGTDTFIVYTKTEHIYRDIANVTNSSNYELDHHLN